jgi:hypothetical protein
MSADLGAAVARDVTVPDDGVELDGVEVDASLEWPASRSPPVNRSSRPWQIEIGGLALPCSGVGGAAADRVYRRRLIRARKEETQGAQKSPVSPRLRDASLEDVVVVGER